MRPAIVLLVSVPEVQHVVPELVSQCARLVEVVTTQDDAGADAAERAAGFTIGTDARLACARVVRWGEIDVGLVDPLLAIAGFAAAAAQL